jgi:membrane protein
LLDRFAQHQAGWQLLRRIAIGTYNDGFIHAGNLAYLSMLAIFPFFITAAAIFTAIGEQSEQLKTINAVLSAMPPMVADVIGPAARDAVGLRSGWLLWVGAVVGLWTVGSLIETIRDILRRAYRAELQGAFWQYRLFSMGLIVAAVLLLLLSLIAQVGIATAQDVITRYFPALRGALADLSLSRLVPVLGVFGSVYLLFLTLTPQQFRIRRFPKWPGAALVTLWWFGVSSALPPLLHGFFTYDLTYGPLAGIMVALLFFWLIGLAIVVGAELNAALAEHALTESGGKVDVEVLGELGEDA